MRLHRTGAFLIRNEDALRTRCNDDIFQPHAKDGHRERIHNMHILTYLIHSGTADRMLRHHFCERVPCSYIEPCAAVALDSNLDSFSTTA